MLLAIVSIGISTGFSQLKLILRRVVRRKIIWSPFFPYQSLLLSTIVLNDTHGHLSTALILYNYVAS